MLMPEAAMHEYYFSEARKHQIRPPRQIATMKPIAVTHSMGHPPHRHFWLHAGAADPAHVLAAIFLGKLVHESGCEVQRKIAHVAKPFSLNHNRKHILRILVRRVLQN